MAYVIYVSRYIGRDSKGPPPEYNCTALPLYSHNMHDVFLLFVVLVVVARQDGRLHCK